jgi:hypothetical protein
MSIERASKRRASWCATSVFSRARRRCQTGMVGWLRTFRVSQFEGVPPVLVQQIEDEIVDLLRPSLCDTAGQWTADYVRLQVVAESAGRS